MYCKKCNIIFNDNICPKCKSKDIREVKPDDDCFLIEKEMVWGEMLSDLLKQNKIPFYFKNVLGAAITANIGPYSEYYRFFVPCSYLERAKNLTDELFNHEEKL